jgi:hypothetical protein
MQVIFETEDLKDASGSLLSVGWHDHSKFVLIRKHFSLSIPNIPILLIEPNR